MVLSIPVVPISLWTSSVDITLLFYSILALTSAWVWPRVNNALP